MTIKTIPFIVFLWMSFSGTCQKYHGYYGKRNFLDITTVSHVPILYNIFSDGRGYKTKKIDGEKTLVTQQKKWMSTGLHLTFYHAKSNKFAFGIEVGFDTWLDKAAAYFSTTVSLSDPTVAIAVTAHERVRYIRTLYMPKLEFAGSSALLPMALSHNIGIGLSRTRIMPQKYFMVYSTSNGEEAVSSDVMNNRQRYSGIHIMYGMKTRVPIGENLLLNYGIRYMLDVMIGNNFSSNESPYYSKNREQIRRSLVYNVISVDLGLTLPL